MKVLVVKEEWILKYWWVKERLRKEGRESLRKSGFKEELVGKRREIKLKVKAKEGRKKSLCLN